MLFLQKEWYKTYGWLWVVATRMPRRTHIDKAAVYVVVLIMDWCHVL